MKGYEMVTMADAFPSKYLKASDLEDGTALATIKLAALEQIKGFDGKPANKVVVYFARTFKPLVCNRTNYESISDIAGSDETDDWAGTKVELFVVPVSFNNKTTDGVRVRKPGVGEKKKATPKPGTGPKPSIEDDMDDAIPAFGE
jgi:hypothetical protein